MSLALAALVLAGCATGQSNPSPTSATAGPRYGIDGSPAEAPAAEAASASAVASGASGIAQDLSTGEITQPTPRPDTRPAAPPVPVDPLQPDVRINLDDATARADLWTRLRRGFAIPDLDSDLVREREQWYATRPDYVARMTERSSRYLFHIVEEVERRGMPTELALLPYVESAFNPQALSTAKASGMWQFIPSTGKDFELKQNLFRDDRRDVLASTRAALDYLARLHDQFGDWHLALAAYNWGEGSVQRAMARNQKLGLPTNYEALNMPNETRNYVPKLQAVKNIIARPDQFGIALPNLDNHPYFLTVPIERDIDVAMVMKFAGMQAEEFRTLNPQLNKPVILASGTPQVLLPYDNASLFVRNMGEHRGNLATWTAWVAPKTLRPAEAASIVGMDESMLREINRIPPKMLVKQGSTLLVRRGANAQNDVSVHIADNAVMTLAPDVPPPVRLTLKAGRNDSIATISRRYGVSPAQVAEWNKAHVNTNFKPGQTIIVYSSRGQAHLAQGTPRRSATELRKEAAAAAMAEAAADKAAAAAKTGKQGTVAAGNATPAVSRATSPAVSVRHVAQKASVTSGTPAANRKAAAVKPAVNSPAVAKARSVRSDADTRAAGSPNSRTRVAQSGSPAARP